jgi:hypothetical protein
MMLGRVMIYDICITTGIASEVLSTSQPCRMAGGKIAHIIRMLHGLITAQSHGDICTLLASIITSKVISSLERNSGTRVLLVSHKTIHHLVSCLFPSVFIVSRTSHPMRLEPVSAPSVSLVLAAQLLAWPEW